MTRNKNVGISDNLVIKFLFIAGMIVGACYMGGCNAIGGLGRDMAEISNRVLHMMHEGSDAEYDRHEYEEHYYRDRRR